MASKRELEKLIEEASYARRKRIRDAYDKSIKTLEKRFGRQVELVQRTVSEAIVKTGSALGKVKIKTKDIRVGKSDYYTLNIEPCPKYFQAYHGAKKRLDNARAEKDRILAEFDRSETDLRRDLAIVGATPEVLERVREFTSAL